jgi:hypothetical protein
VAPQEDHDEARPAEIVVAGDLCRLVLTVYGYEHPGATNYDDANWVMAKARLMGGRHGNDFQATTGVSLRTVELKAFRDSLATLLERLTGEVRMEHMEQQVCCTNGRGEMEASLREHVGAELRIQSPIDQTYLAPTVADLDTVLRLFPPRVV